MNIFYGILIYLFMVIVAAVCLVKKDKATDKTPIGMCVLIAALPPHLLVIWVALVIGSIFWVLIKITGYLSKVNND